MEITSDQRLNKSAFKPLMTCVEMNNNKYQTNTQYTRSAQNM